MQLQQLFPPGPPTDALALLAAELPGDPADDERPFVLANMISTLDGVAAMDGGSSALGGRADKAMFAALRTVSDAVLAGTGTVAAEEYGRLAPNPERRAARERLGLAPEPAMVMITRSGTVPWDAPLFSVAEQPVIVFCSPDAVTVPHEVAARVTVAELEPLTNAAALSALRADYGVRALLCEGGPKLLRSLIADGLLDELFLTVDPLLAGGDNVTRILAGHALDTPARARLTGVLRGGDELLLRYRLAVD